MRSSMRIVSSLFVLMITVPPVFAEEVDPPADAGETNASGEASSTSETNVSSEVSEPSEANNSGQSGSPVEGDLLPPPPMRKLGNVMLESIHRTPPVYKTKYEQVLKRAASESVSIIPPKFETVEETVLI